MKYSNGFRARMVQHRVGPEGIGAIKLAEEIGVHQTTPSRWLREASGEEKRERRGGHVKSAQVRERLSVRPDDLPPAEKYRLVMEASTLSEDEPGAFLRRNGLHVHRSKSGARRSRRPRSEPLAARRNVDAASLPRRRESSSSSAN